MMFHSSSFQHGTNCQILVTSVDVRCNLAPTHITKRGTKQQICVQYFCAAPQIQSPQLVILIAASGVFRSSCTANCSYVDLSHPTTKPRLGPPGCILNCCGVVVWSGQQQHAGPCITLSSFLEIPNGSRVRVWDAAAAGCWVYFIPIHYGAAAPSKQRVWLTSLLCLCTI